MPRLNTSRQAIKFGLLLAAMALLIIGWANPQAGTKRQTVLQRSLDTFIALDISNSMLCEDVPPNRLEQARRFAYRLLDELAGNRIGLILFAGDAFVAVPLTTDYQALRMAISTAHPRQASFQGTDLAQAFKLARQSFPTDEQSARVILLITDGEDHEGRAVEELQQAAKEGIIAFTIGVGTPSGGPIPIEYNGQTTFLKDPATQQPAITRLREDLLRKMASEGKGLYFHINQGDAILQTLDKRLAALEKREMEVRSFAEYNSYFQYFLLAAVLLLAFDMLLPANADPKRPDA